MKLTAKTIDGIKLLAGKSEHVEFDDEIAGFFLRIRAGGSRTLGYQYKIGKQHRRITLGPAVKEAFPGVRQRVLDLVAQVRLGKDPAVERDAARTPASAPETFEKIARRFLIEQAKRLKPRTLVETERYLTVVAKPLHARPAAEITRRDIAELLSVAAAERGDVTANRLRSNLATMFTWAMKEGLLEANPVASTNKRAEAARDRVLSIGELVEIWKAVDGNSCADPVRLLMLTACRRDEIGGLRWSELDEGMTRITLSKDRVQNGREHIVPLSEPGRAIMTQCRQVVGWSCVFSSVPGGLRSWAQYKDQIDERLPHIPHWTFHDLRRSAATHMAEQCGVQPHIIEAILNHMSGHKAGVAGIYNRATYLPEKTAALTLWAEHLMAAVTGKSAKVVPLRA